MGWWIHSLGVGGTIWDDVRASLDGAVLAESRAPDIAATPGVVVVGGADAETIEQLQALLFRSQRIIVITSASVSSREEVTRLLATGVADVIAWENAAAAMARVAAHAQRWAEVDAALASASARRPVIGTSRIWTAFIGQLAQAAMFSSAPVLLLGESGTGKEQLAHFVHLLGRRKGSCVVVDCSTVEPGLSGSEFFGHEKGSFTGANGQREGAFLLAHEGTLFLDEVGELPPPLQAQLLRVSQEKTYKRLGGNHWFESDFRLVSATHRDLAEEVKLQRFRFDFLQRIGTWTFRVPPLAERPEDILPLARHFARRALGERFTGISAWLGDELAGRAYPGNVRELEQLVVRACSRHVGDGVLCLSDLAEVDRPRGASSERELRDTFEQCSGRAVLAGLGLKELLRQARGAAIRTALHAHHQNVRDAARLLGITDRALQMELAKREA